uniref:Uncharacterized protein n=1 Tax=Panagrolaimus davidi TaxID=227884 RepID=A0A914PDH4_9BILA
MLSLLVFNADNTMNPFHNINRDPRIYGKNNNDRQFFPTSSTTPGPSFPMTPSYAERTPKLMTPSYADSTPKPMHREKASTIDPTTLAVVRHTNNKDRDILHVDFYNAFKNFPTSNFSSDVHVNCVTSLKRIFSLFKDNDKLVRGKLDDARRRNDELFRILTEKEEKIRQLEYSEAEAKKASDDGKESVSKMQIDTLRYKTETDKAKNGLSFVTSEKNRLIVAISDEKDRHMKTVAKYDALNVQYGSLFRENDKLHKDLNKLRQKIEQMEAEKVEKHPTPPPQEPASSHSSRRADKKKAVVEVEKSSESLPTQNLPEETSEMSDAAEKKTQEKEKPPMPTEISENEDEQPTPSGSARRQRPSNTKKAQETTRGEDGKSGNEEEQPTSSGSARCGKKSTAAAKEKTPVETPKENESTPSTQARRTSAIYQKPKPKKSTPRQKRSHPPPAVGNEVEAHEEEETTTIAPPPAKRGRSSTKK